VSSLHGGLAFYAMRRLALALILATGLGAAGCGASPRSPRSYGPQHAYQTAYGPSAHAPGFGHPPRGTTLRPTLLAPSAALLAPQDQYDTITLASVPRGAPYLAGYTAGFWPTFGPLRALPWHPHVISIAIASGFHAMCLDIEGGDAQPFQAPGWYHAVRAAYLAHLLPLIGGKPCLYSSFWEFVQQVIPIMRANGIPRSAYWGWDANYDYFRHIDAGFDATQYTDHAFGRNLDASAATYAFLGASPPRPGPVYPICFRHREPRSSCAAARSAIAQYERAAASSSRAYSRRGCPALARRDAWFSRQLRLHPHSARAAYRRRALAATRRAESRAACSVFAGREAYFANLIQRTRAAN
jgi:hypothetical protein